MNPLERYLLFIQHRDGVRGGNGGRSSTEEESRQNQPNRELLSDRERVLFPDASEKRKKERER